jgi:hypothetical protein
MPETYSLILNSQNTTNIVNNSSLSAYQYNISWDAILPRKYQKYSVRFQLRSTNIQSTVFVGVITTAGTINVTAINVGLPTNTQGAPIIIGTQFFIGSVLQTITGFGTGTGGIGTYTVSPGAVTGSANYNTLTGESIQNMICSVNFGYNTTYEQNNSQSTILGTIEPRQYNRNANVYIFTYNCSISDNGPIQIGYPSNQVITVRFLQMDGKTPVAQMLDYQLQLYFEPIKE